VFYLFLPILIKSHAWDTGITTVRLRSMDVRERVGKWNKNLGSGPSCGNGCVAGHRAVTAYTRCWSTATKIFLGGWSGERSKVCSHPSDVCRGDRAPRDVWTNLSASREKSIRSVGPTHVDSTWRWQCGGGRQLSSLVGDLICTHGASSRCVGVGAVRVQLRE
jgi:hypothetical protein